MTSLSISEDRQRGHFRGEGVDLVGDVAGDPNGQPVLLLHGGSQTRHSWQGALTALAKAGYYAIALDLRGHGDSDWAPDQDYRLDRFVEDIQAVCTKLRRPPILIGASLGGLTSLLLTGEHPGSAAALVLVDIAPRIEQDGAAEIRGFLMAYPDGFGTLDDVADAVAAYLPHRPRPTDTSGLLKNVRTRPDGRLRWHWDPGLVEGERSSNPAGLEERFLSAARQIRVPTLLLRGAYSNILSEEGAHEFVEMVPGCEYVDVAGAAHMIAADRNDQFNAAILDFLARNIPVDR